MTAQQQHIVNLADWRRDHGSTGNAPAWQPPIQATCAVSHEPIVFNAGGGNWPMFAAPTVAVSAVPSAEIVILPEGPHIRWMGVDPDELQVMALALMDAARAARNGDDPNEVARQEWTRRGGRPEPD